LMVLLFLAPLMKTAFCCLLVGYSEKERNRHSKGWFYF